MTRSRGLPVNIEGKRYFAGVGLDITKQKKLENEIKQTHCVLHDITNQKKEERELLFLSHTDVLAVLIHDIGKIGIDEKILNKPDKHTKEEKEDIQRHSEIGWWLISPTNEFS